MRYVHSVVFAPIEKEAKTNNLNAVWQITVWARFRLGMFAFHSSWVWVWVWVYLHEAQIGFGLSNTACLSCTLASTALKLGAYFGWAKSGSKLVWVGPKPDPNSPRFTHAIDMQLL
eukprot:TRINITY_DN4700_c0_g1_i3.p1 TRINITY_DN4700_c0_g1~~TRINITY_DN4700_c0_g1_i3.p1  ORF type:complete len:116 (+),score=8.99 TRINITY_DN4700_c0_g1_i3:274-621(+)